MSPTDEIRWINKLAAKHGKKNLSKYHQWVLGGCKGPHPMMRKEKKKPKRAKAILAMGPCPKTKVSTKHYRQIVALKEANVRLRDRIRVLEAKVKRARSELK